MFRPSSCSAASNWPHNIYVRVYLVTPLLGTFGTLPGPEAGGRSSGARETKALLNGFRCAKKDPVSGFVSISASLSMFRKISSLKARSYQVPVMKKVPDRGRPTSDSRLFGQDPTIEYFQSFPLHIMPKRGIISKQYP